MPPRFRRGGRGKEPASAPNDHEAGPSFRRTTSTRNDETRELWRTYEDDARRSFSHSSTPPYHDSYGPQSENEPHNPQRYFGDPTPVFQGQFNPAEYLPEQVGFNPLGPEDHFSGDQDMDEDTDPVEASTGSFNHPFVISDGSSYHGTPYQGPDSHMARFERCEWYNTPSHHTPSHHTPSHHTPSHHTPSHSASHQQPHQDSFGGHGFVAVTPPPPPPPVHLEPPAPPRRRRTGPRMSVRPVGVHINTPQHSSGSHYPPTHEGPQMGGSSVPVSEVNSAPIEPSPTGFGHPIPAYTAPATYNPYGPPAYHGYNYADDPYNVASGYHAHNNPEGPYGPPWGMGYPTQGYQAPVQPPPHYQPPGAPLHEQEELRRRLAKVEQDFQKERKKNEGFMSGLASLLKGKKKKRDR